MNPTMTTWRKELSSAKEATNDNTEIVALAPDDVTTWDTEFNPGYGHAQGPSVLAWTESHVYFPVCYDGSEWLGSAPRNPQALGQSHVGG